VDANADIDAMLDLESPRRSKPSGDSTAGGDNKIDVAFRNLPTVIMHELFCFKLQKLY